MTSPAVRHCSKVLRCRQGGFIHASAGDLQCWRRETRPQYEDNSVSRSINNQNIRHKENPCVTFYCCRADNETHQQIDRIGSCFFSMFGRMCTHCGLVSGGGLTFACDYETEKPKTFVARPIGYVNQSRRAHRVAPKELTSHRSNPPTELSIIVLNLINYSNYHTCRQCFITFCIFKLCCFIAPISFYFSCFNNLLITFYIVLLLSASVHFL